MQGFDGRISLEAISIETSDEKVYVLSLTVGFLEYEGADLFL